VLRQPASGFAIAGVAAVVGRSGGEAGGPIDDVRVAVTGVGDVPYRATAVEATVRGQSIGPAEVDEAVRAITDGVRVQGDIHAGPDYRAAMTREMATRALRSAMARLG
jgi:carbon-monoxide dehydrogenase medium subunit